MSSLEIVAVIVNILGVWLTAQRIRWCWPVSVVAVLLYAWIFFGVKLYSDMLLQLVFAVLQGYGWWRWSSGQSVGGKVRVERLPLREAVLSLLAGLLGAVLLGSLMHLSPMPPCLGRRPAHRLQPGGQLLGGAQVPGQLGLWIILDVAYVGLFLYKDLQLTAALYAGFVVLAGYGLHAWRKDLRHQERPLAAAAEATA